MPAWVFLYERSVLNFEFWVMQPEAALENALESYTAAVGLAVGLADHWSNREA